MSSNELEEHIKQLLERSNADAESGNLQQAAEALKEASYLDSNDGRVKDAIIALQTREQTGDASNLVHKYFKDGNEDDGRRALQAVQQRQLPDAQARQLWEIILHDTDGRPLLDDLTAAILSQSSAVRKHVASQFSTPHSQHFAMLFHRGEEGFKAFATIPFDVSVWTSKDQQKAAQVDTFQLCIAKLMEAGVDHPERLMRVIARQLAIAPDNVADIIDSDVFDIIVSSLDIRLEPKLRSQAMLATSKILETTKEKGEQLFGHYLTHEVAKGTNDDLISAFSAAAAVFPMLPAFSATLFMTDGFVQQLVPSLERNSEAASQGQRKSRTLEQAALELLSAACVDKSCREAIERYCSPWLRGLSAERDGKHKALAALVLAKTNSASQEEVTAKLADLVMVGDSEREQAVEGLAYTSLQPKIKEEIAADQRLLRRLIVALNERPSAAFGCLTIFANLTTYRPTQTAEQKKMTQLKAYANSKKPEPENPLDDDTHVTMRAKKLLDVDVVSAILGCCKQTSSLTNIALIVRTLLAMSREKAHRPKMVQQGSVRVLLQIRERIAKTDKATAEAGTIERTASHALARLLISVNPSHVFSASLSASSAVTALILLLSVDNNSEQRDLLPTFEALLALTNLASMEDNSIRDLQIRSAWDKLEDLVFSQLTLVQRASVELICNLMASPSGVAKFADGSGNAKRRMRILIAVADVEDLATRRAAGGALAMLTEWDTAVTALLDSEKSIGVLLSMCEDDSDEMQHRGFVCLLNVVSAPGNIGERGAQALKDAKAALVLQDALRQSRNPEVLRLGVDVLKKIQG